LTRKANRLFRGYYFITDSSLSLRGNKKDVASALAAGVRLIQYRAKDLEDAEVFDEGLFVA